MTQQSGFAVPLFESLLRLTAAVTIGSVIGLNRELHHKPAGLRTHALVALGAASIALTGIEMCNPGDPNGASRVIQGIITGIGFLGAGVILHPANEGSILGLTTAASLWVVAGLGIGCGAGLWESTFAAAALTLLVLVFGVRVERLVTRRLAAKTDAGERRPEE